MQTQKRIPSLRTRNDKKSPAAPAPRQDVRSAPIELDTSALRHVAGGNGEQGPKKYW
jgi:hypothetical protein